MSKLVRVDRCLVLVSAGWLGALWQTPGLADVVAAFAATVGLISLNALVAFRSLTRNRRVLIGLNCAQLVLFGTLHYQLHGAFGDGHFQFDRETRFYDWIEFTAVHILRAADFLDALDEFGIPIQTITHRSTTAGVLLVCMHLTVDIFLLGLLMRWLASVWPTGPTETHLQRGRREFGWLLATLTLYVVFGVGLSMRPADWLLWPLENLLRLVDVGDFFQVFGWHLHEVEDNFWTRGAALLFRLAAGIWMTRLVIWLRTTLLRTWGFSVAELIELLDDPDAPIRRGAAEGLGQSGMIASDAVPWLVSRLHDLDPHVRREAARSLGRIGPEARDAVPELIDTVWRDRREIGLAAAEALGQIGADASEAVASLVTFLKVCDAEAKEVVGIALERIAPGILRYLQERTVSPSRI